MNDVGSGRRFLTARWAHLAMLNYEIDPAHLAPRVPHGTELDPWRGRTLVSMVGFRFLDTRVLGVPVPFHRHFDEVNLRFYVRRRVAGEVRRGVVFVKEIVPRAAIAWLARVLYNENYLALPMAHDIRLGQDDPSIVYRWRYRGREQRLGVRPVGEPAVPEEGSEAQFIAEHYWGYAAQRDGSTLEYRVDHPPWAVWQVGAAELHCDAGDLYGGEFEAPLRAAPTSAFLALGSPVVVRRGRRIPQDE